MSKLVYTPCLSEITIKNALEQSVTIGSEPITNPHDQLTFTVTGKNKRSDLDSEFKYDLYFMFVNLSASGIDNSVKHAQIYLLEREKEGVGGNAETDSVEVQQYATASQIKPNDATKYLSAKQFIDENIDETILAGNIIFDDFDLPQGTWMALSIFGDTTSEVAFSFENPKTWAAWDADIFILGSPIRGSGSSGTGKCK